MIYLKAKNGQVKEFKDTDTKTVEFLLGVGWSRVMGRKDLTPYSTPKASKKKTKKKSN